MLYWHFGVCSLSPSRLKVYKTTTVKHQLGEQWSVSVAKALIAKLDNLNLILSTNMVEGDN